MKFSGNGNGNGNVFTGRMEDAALAIPEEMRRLCRRLEVAPISRSLLKYSECGNDAKNSDGHWTRRAMFCGPRRTSDVYVSATACGAVEPSVSPRRHFYTSWAPFWPNSASQLPSSSSTAALAPRWGLSLYKQKQDGDNRRNCGTRASKEPRLQPETVGK